ncbi:MAG: AarF/UbiB family protein [Kiritimatiellae bacterium]|nr:AarF/UbiB family protein [Kiritimatiellia bacterium]
MRLTRLGRLQPYRNVKRLRRIAAVFIGCFFSYICARIRLRREMKRSGVAVDVSVCLGTALRTAFERLGPTFIKFGQVLSTRRDLLPDGVANELARLQDGVEAMPLADAVKAVESEYGRPISQIFADFSEQPLGAASLSQVHAARLSATGEAVVVKIQRPGIQAMVDTDIDILSRFIPLLERHVEELRHLNLRSIVEEFYKTIRMEMDFKREMHNTLKFRKIFDGDPNVKIPLVYKDLCTEKVLVLEKLEGVKIDRLDELLRLGYDRDTLSKKLVALLSKQVFTHGVYNGDVHAGNILVMPGPTIGLFDFGMVRTIDPETQKLMIDLFVAVVTKDAVRMSRILAAYAEPNHTPDTMRLARDLHELLVFYYDLPAEDLRVDTMLEIVMDLLATHKLVVPQQLIMLCRAAVMTESIVRMLSPKMYFVVELAPFIKDAIKNRFSLSNVRDELGRLAADGTRAIRALPAALGTFLTNMNDGVLRIESQHRDLERHAQQFSRMTTCLAMSVIGGALFLGSALLVAFAKDNAPGLAKTGQFGLVAAAFLICSALLKLFRKQ